VYCENAVVLSNDEFELFRNLLIEESGLSFDKNKIHLLSESIWDRLAERGCTSYAEYYNLLKFNPEGRTELRRLVDSLTIGETYFFRNEPYFQALIKNILPEIVNAKMYSANKSIRIWSAGCSRGAEPYSIAMAVMEIVPFYEDWNISILGTDINKDVLIAAKEAVYSKRDVDCLPEGYLDKYFQARGDSYVLKESVKKLVKFECHNLAKGSFSQDDMQNLDMLFCRNVIIYFDTQTIRRVIDNFYNCLGLNGYLFLGPAETLWQMPNNKFATVEFPNVFLYRKQAYAVKQDDARPFIGIPDIRFEQLPSAAETADAVSESEPQTIIGKISKPKLDKDIEPLYNEAIGLFNEKNYSQALELLDKIISQDKNCAGVRFAKATILANQAKYDYAFKELKKIIEIDNLHINAYYLLGVLSYKTGDLKEAETQFRKVIYIDSKAVLAYFNLGDIYLRQKKNKNAAREFNNAVRLLETMAKDQQIRFCEDITAELLLMACKNNLAKIENKG
jgi:chemotaxis protein methyltransferase CheR